MFGPPGVAEEKGVYRWITESQVVFYHRYMIAITRR